MGTCRQCGSWSVAGCSHKKVIGRDPICASQARHGPWPVQKRFIRDHVWWGRSKPGCRIVGSVTIVWLTTEAINIIHTHTHGPLTSNHRCKKRFYIFYSCNVFNVLKYYWNIFIIKTTLVENRNLVVSRNVAQNCILMIFCIVCNAI